MSARARMTATVEANGKTATGVEVPAEVVAALGSSKRPAVRATINGYSYRSSIASMGGRFMLSISAEVRKNAGISAGDEIEVDLVLDTAKREVAVPDDLAAALAQDSAAKTYFDGLAYSHQLRHVLAIDAAKAPETRQRRVAKSVELFAAGRHT